MCDSLKYDAFISYRHTPFDKKVAITLLKLLETYKVPKSIHLPKRQITRVFRDQEELPTSSNLASNIYEALTQSRFLIVICSPDTPKSKWVEQEIETFSKLHGSENILTLLISGEPHESFPLPLQYQEVDGEQIEVEPLAADIRASSEKESLKQLEKEVLRLIAPILGCNYDTLKQRHKERETKRLFTLTGATIIFLASFGSYSALQANKLKVQSELTQQANNNLQAANAQLQTQMNETYKVQSLYMSEKSLSTTQYGDRTLGAYIALSSLPQDLANPNRPYVPQSEYALNEALYPYHLDAAIIKDQVLSHTLPIETMDLSPDGRYLLSQQNNHTLSLWDTETGYLLWTLSPKNNLVGQQVYFLNNNLFAVYDDGLKIYSLENYDLVQEFNYPDVTSLYLNEARNTFIIEDESFKMVDATSGNLLNNIQKPFSYVNQAILSPDGKTLACTNYDGDFALIPLEHPTQVILKSLPDAASSHITFSPDSQKILFTYNIQTTATETDGNAQVYNLKGDVLYTSSVKDYGYTLSQFSPADSNLIALSSHATLEIIDLATQKPLHTFINGGNINDLVWSSDGTLFIVGSSDGTIRFYSIDSPNEFTDWRIENDEPITKILKGPNRLCSIPFSSRDIKLYTTIYDNNYTPLGLSPLISTESSGGIRGVLTDDGCFAALYNLYSNVLELWDTKSQKLLKTSQLTSSSLTWVSFYEDYLYYLGDEAILHRLNLTTLVDESIDLGLIPDKVSSSQNYLLLADARTYQLIDLADFTTTPLQTVQNYIDSLASTSNGVYLSTEEGLTYTAKDGTSKKVSDLSMTLTPSLNGQKVTAFNQNHIAVYSEGNMIYSYDSPVLDINACFLDPTDSKLIIQYTNNAVEIFDLFTKKTVGKSFDLNTRLERCIPVTIDNSIVLVTQYNRAVKLDCTTYERIFETPHILDISQNGSTVLIDKIGLSEDYNLLLYPYYTTELTIKRAQSFLQNRYIDPAKKAQNYIE